MAEVEAHKIQQLEEGRQQEEEQKEEELARLWKELVHKGNLIQKYRTVEVKLSDQPLTVPVSPKFSTPFHWLSPNCELQLLLGNRSCSSHHTRHGENLFLQTYLPMPVRAYMRAMDTHFAENCFCAFLTLIIQLNSSMPQTPCRFIFKHQLTLTICLNSD
jgi:hypothetical protein